jgi:hypothetical protein
MVTRLAIGMLPALLAGCLSSPRPHALSEDQEQRVDGLASRINAIQVDACAPELTASWCAFEAEAFTRTLRDSGLFRAVEDYGAQDSQAELRVELQRLPQNPYWASPAHNPGALVLLLAIPLPWHTEHGYVLALRCKGRPPVTVDTFRSGRSVVWSLASVLNLLPGRGFGDDARLEVRHLVLQAAEELEQCDPSG